MKTILPIVWLWGKNETSNVLINTVSTAKQALKSQQYPCSLLLQQRYQRCPSAINGTKVRSPGQNLLLRGSSKSGRVARVQVASWEKRSCEKWTKKSEFYNLSPKLANLFCGLGTGGNIQHFRVSVSSSITWKGWIKWLLKSSRANIQRFGVRAW